MPDSPRYSTAAVAAPHQLAADVGRDLLAQGANAIEAMVGMAASVAVAYPHMNGLGGDGFWLLRSRDGKALAIEACGYAGSLATRARYRNRAYVAVPTRGPDAALTVAGAVGGWIQALEHSRALGGRMPLRDLLAPAIAQARNGVPVSASEARYPVRDLAELLAVPGFRDAFRAPDGTAHPAGTERRQPALAALLEQLAHAGLDDFYRGDAGREIAADLERLGSPVTRRDLEGYRAADRRPLTVELPDATLYNCPPPTQGLASLLLHAVHDRRGPFEPESFAHHHGLVEAAKRAYGIRDRVVTDYDRLTADPADFLTGERIAREAAAIAGDRAGPWPPVSAEGDTIWMGAIDRNGLAVSFIQSLYWDYGSGLYLPGSGLLWQNRGMAFSLDPAALNPLEPGRRPFHTLNCPLAVFRDGRVVSYGAMGGDGQPQFQAQIFFRALRHGVPVADAIDRPRFLFGKTWGADSATLKLESRFDPDVAKALEKAGHVVEWHKLPYADLFGHAGMLVRHPDGSVEAAHDPRSDGGSAGL